MHTIAALFIATGVQLAVVGALPLSHRPNPFIKQYHEPHHPPNPWAPPPHPQTDPFIAAGKFIFCVAFTKAGFISDILDIKINRKDKPSVLQCAPAYKEYKQAQRNPSGLTDREQHKWNVLHHLEAPTEPTKPTGPKEAKKEAQNVNYFFKAKPPPNVVFPQEFVDKLIKAAKFDD